MLDPILAVLKLNVGKSLLDNIGLLLEPVVSDIAIFWCSWIPNGSIIFVVILNLTIDWEI